MSIKIEEIEGYKIGDILTKSSNLSKWMIVEIKRIEHLISENHDYTFIIKSISEYCTNGVTKKRRFSEIKEKFVVTNIKVGDFLRKNLDGSYWEVMSISDDCEACIRHFRSKQLDFIYIYIDNIYLVKNYAVVTTEEVQNALKEKNTLSKDLIKKGMKFKRLATSVIYVLKDIDVKTHLEDETTTDYVLENISENNTDELTRICSLCQLQMYYDLVNDATDCDVAGLQIRGFASSNGVTMGDFFQRNFHRTIWEVVCISPSDIISLKNIVNNKITHVNLEFLRQNFDRVSKKDPRVINGSEVVKEHREEQVPILPDSTKGINSQLDELKVFNSYIDDSYRWYKACKAKMDNVFEKKEDGSRWVVVGFTRTVFTWDDTLIVVRISKVHLPSPWYYSDVEESEDKELMLSDLLKNYTKLSKSETKEVPKAETEEVSEEVVNSIKIKTDLIHKEDTIQAVSYMGDREINKQIHSLGSNVNIVTFVSNEVKEVKEYIIVKYSFSYVKENKFNGFTIMEVVLKFEKATGYLKSSIVNESNI